MTTQKEDSGLVRKLALPIIGLISLGAVEFANAADAKMPADLQKPTDSYSTQKPSSATPSKERENKAEAIVKGFSKDLQKPATPYAQTPVQAPLQPSTTAQAKAPEAKKEKKYSISGLVDLAGFSTKDNNSGNNDMQVNGYGSELNADVKVLWELSKGKPYMKISGKAVKADADASYNHSKIANINSLEDEVDATIGCEFDNGLGLGVGGNIEHRRAMAEIMGFGPNSTNIINENQEQYSGLMGELSYVKNGISVAFQYKDKSFGNVETKNNLGLLNREDIISGNERKLDIKYNGKNIGCEIVAGQKTYDMKEDTTNTTLGAYVSKEFAKGFKASLGNRTIITEKKAANYKNQQNQPTFKVEVEF